MGVVRQGGGGGGVREDRAGLQAGVEVREGGLEKDGKLPQGKQDQETSQVGAMTSFI